MINFFQWCATAFLFGLYLFSNCLTDFGIKTGDQDDSMGEFLSANNKNSSGDEIANVNFFYDDIAHVLQNTKQENLLRLTN